MEWADSTSPPPMRLERQFTGLPVSGGVVLARVRILAPRAPHAVPSYTISPGAILGEICRLDAAIGRVSAQMGEIIAEATRKMGAARANIFVAQKLMAEDPALRDAIAALIESDCRNAEAAVDQTLIGYESLLCEVDNEYMRERSTDIAEMRRRLLDALGESAAPQGMGDDPGGGYYIVAAEELTPSETMALDTSFTAGFITERGGPMSHAAILARALGIPAVSGIQNLFSVLRQGDDLLLNGDTGEITLWPSEATLRVYPALRKPAPPRMQRVARIGGFAVRANINFAAEAASAVEVDAEGIGLYRTELEVLANNRPLTEDEQYERYAAVCEAVRDHPIHIRLFDLGGDKAADFLGIPPEQNPALGYRGARLLLERPELLIPQVRALGRASRISPIHILYPMLVDHLQFLRLRSLVRQHLQDVPHGLISHGAMLEIPSACLDAGAICRNADFVCVGSNDLIQYLFAADRNNSLVSQDYALDHEVLWVMLQTLSETALAAGIPISLCGELASHPAYLPRLIRLGYHSVSVNPRFVGLCRKTAGRHLHHLGLGDCETEGSV